MDDHSGQISETVLVVDGVVITRTVISDYLRHCGYRVIEANSGEEALQVLQHEKFDVAVVLSDVDLPGEISGFALALWVRRNRFHIPIVLSTVERAAERAGELCEQGPAVSKPYDPQLVVDHIRRLRANSRWPTSLLRCGRM